MTLQFDDIEGKKNLTYFMFNPRESYHIGIVEGFHDLKRLKTHFSFVLEYNSKTRQTQLSSPYLKGEFSKFLATTGQNLQNADLETLKIKRENTRDINPNNEIVDIRPSLFALCISEEQKEIIEAFMKESVQDLENRLKSLKQRKQNKRLQNRLPLFFNEIINSYNCPTYSTNRFTKQKTIDRRYECSGGGSGKIRSPGRVSFLT